MKDICKLKGDTAEIQKLRSEQNCYGENGYPKITEILETCGVKKLWQQGILLF